MKKPLNWSRFDNAARKVAKVPKEQVDAKIAADKKARTKKKKRKS